MTLIWTDLCFEMGAEGKLATGINTVMQCKNKVKLI